MCFSLSILESFKNLATKHKNLDLIEESIRYATKGEHDRINYRFRF